jgi:hypothetical protein
LLWIFRLAVGLIHKTAYKARAIADVWRNNAAGGKRLLG